jgi:hypothetical protein
MPLTAWMMAHRLEHIFLTKDYAHYDDTQKKLAECVVQTIQAYDPKWSPNKRYKGMMDFMDFGIGAPIIKPFVYKVFTMRSARSQRLNNGLDYNAELMAQWLLTGSIKFNLVPISIHSESGRKKVSYDIHTNKYTNEYPTFTLDSEKAEKLNQMWQNLATELAKDYDLLFKSMVGKVLCL